MIPKLFARYKKGYTGIKSKIVTGNATLIHKGQVNVSKTGPKSVEPWKPKLSVKPASL